MVKLYLVGFTTDLKNLIFAKTRGAKSGTFLVNVDGRLRRALEEVARLEAEEKAAKKAAKKAEKGARSSKLTPREIQELLRRGRSPQEVAKLAETDVAWIERFTSPILAERAGVVEAVRASYVAKQRLGPSAVPVGPAMEANLRERRVNLTSDDFDDAWTAVRREGRWEVSFRYKSRGHRRTASFGYDPESRAVRALNDLARSLAWRSSDQRRPVKRKRTVATGPSRRRRTTPRRGR